MAREAWSSLGSSPLARGLRVLPGYTPGRDGIIPARAGFTRAEAGVERIQRDHPRSRGVYRSRSCASACPMGSSPLARGLPRALPDAAPSGRIIPARAGFTSRPEPMRRADADHPRSRGVYPRGREEEARMHRIIPARAGFTARRVRAHPRRWDHPRSRGVYCSGSWWAPRSRGSSPLARGLHPRAVPQAPVGGIIPARAGFTAAGSCRPRTWPDHPRSRGVYSKPIRAGLSSPGSSPLARGLRLAVRPGAAAARIIPARAGFTTRCPTGRGRCPDHPRSRGVYAALCG